MESPFETLEQHDDHAHSDETSREKLEPPKQKQNLGPPPKTALGGLAGGLDTSNLRGNFTGLQVIFLFLLLEGERILLGPGEPKTGGPTGTYSTRPSSTMSDILTPGLDAVSTRGLLPWCHR